MMYRCADTPSTMTWCQNSRCRHICHWSSILIRCRHKLTPLVQFFLSNEKKSCFIFSKCKTSSLVFSIWQVEQSNKPDCLPELCRRTNQPNQQIVRIVRVYCCCWEIKMLLSKQFPISRKQESLSDTCYVIIQNVPIVFLDNFLE